MSRREGELLKVSHFRPLLGKNIKWFKGSYGTKLQQMLGEEKRSGNFRETLQKYVRLKLNIKKPLDFFTYFKPHCYKLKDT